MEVGQTLKKLVKDKKMGDITSKKTNKNIVLGASLMNEGVQPLKRNPGPSFRRDFRIRDITEPF